MNKKVFLNLTQKQMKLQVLLWLPESGPIIEIGSGKGDFAGLINQIGRRRDYKGIELQKRHVEFAGTKIKKMQTCFFHWDILDYTQEVLAASFGGVVCSFQTLEHIGTVGGLEDIKVIKAIPTGVPIIFSVPNFDSKDHKRVFSWKKWADRYNSYLNFRDSVIYNTKKKSKLTGVEACTFLFYAVRNGNNDG